MVDIKKGSDLPASAYRDAQSEYLVEDSLGLPGPKDSDVVSVLRRADALGDANGRTSLFELDVFDSAPALSYLFPREQAALARAHQSFLVPSASLQTPSPLAMSYELVTPDRLQLSTLSEPQRQAADRYQLVQNDDANSATISFADLQNLEAVIASGALTAAEQTSLREVFALLAPHARLQVGGAFAQVREDYTNKEIILSRHPIKDGAVELVASVRWELSQAPNGALSLRASQLNMQLVEPNVSDVVVQCEGLSHAMTRLTGESIRTVSFPIGLKNEKDFTFLIRWTDASGQVIKRRIKVAVPVIANVTNGVSSGQAVTSVKDQAGKVIKLAQPVVVP